MKQIIKALVISFLESFADEAGRAIAQLIFNKKEEEDEEDNDKNKSKNKVKIEV